MEEKYYFIHYSWKSAGNNFYCEVIDIHPMDWYERVNRGYYKYTNDKGKIKNHCAEHDFKLMFWSEISKEHYDNAKNISLGDYTAKQNLALSYGKNPFK
jgi:hypothetical protein